MQLSDINIMLKKTGYPVAYHHFNATVNAPYIAYYVPSVKSIGADDEAYIEVSSLRIELYTDKKDLSAEKAVEDILHEADIFYGKSEVWIDEEKLFEVVYESEVI